MIQKIKQKKYIALLLITVLVIGIISLISFGRTDKYAGLVKVKNTNIDTKLLSSTGVLLDSSSVYGNSTAEYTVSFTLEPVEGVTSRTAIVKGTLTDAEAKYARFKRVEGTGITSTLSDNGKSIQVEIENVPLGVEKSIKLRVIIENAPNNFTVKPNIYVQERTSEDRHLDAPEIVVTTNSIEGVVTDTNDLPVGNIEIVAKSNGSEIKRTYTDENGSYTITDLAVGNYEIDIDEEVYETTEKKVVDVEGTTRLNLKVRAVEPYTIETHKYVEKLDLVVDGEEKHYTYDDAEKVLETIRRANSISGKIEYKLVVENTGTKSGTVTRVQDEASEGLRLNTEENIGWEEVDGIYYYRPIEGTELKNGESREIGLVLEIESTNAAKTYVNKMTAKGELYEKVVFILDGEKYKETSVLEGEKVDEVIISDENFSGWYTDSNLTNRYNFNLPVRKDMILYGEINKPKCTVTFMDFGNIYDRQVITCGTKATRPSDPQHEGYTFDKWIDEDEYEFDPNEPIERDVTYFSKNDLIVYKIEYEGLTEDEEDSLHNPIEYTIVSDSITLANPNNRVDLDGDPSEAFIGWTTPNNPSPDMVITIPTGSTGDRKYIANWTPIAPDEYTITYYLYGGALEQGKSNPEHYNKTTETFTLNNPSKLGYDFAGWTGTDLDSATTTVTVQTGSRGDRVYYANYVPTKYRITYNLEGGNLPEGEENPTEYTIESAPITLINPTKEGHQFTGWTGTDLVGKNTLVTIPTGSTGDREYTATYEKNKYTVLFMDGDVQHAKQTVEHGDLATLPDPSPSKAHHIFLGWTLDGTLYDFNTPVTHDITLYSSYEEVLPPTITHTPDLPEWTNQFVTVTVASDHEDYSYVYHVGSESNENYSEPFKVYDNGRVYAYSVKSGVNSVEVYHDITNIDKIKPEIRTLDLDYATINEAKIDFTAFDGQSGLKEIKLYKKLATEQEYTYLVSFNYNRETTTLQSEEYEFTNLADGTTYDVKLVAYDYAGNISEEAVLEFTTTPAPTIVARIIKVGNVPLPEEEYIYLPTLKSGIEYNESGTNCLITQCTIQMLKSVNETNDISGGQNITLDLNGQTVNGIGEYTIRVNNGAQFTLIDDAEFDEESYNESNHNSLKNEIDRAIINNGTLTIGEGRTGEDVSVYVPLVRGKNSGVDTVNGTFKFYDGRIIASTAISGEVEDAPDMYSPNVEIKTEDEQTIQVATLKRVTDVEARIGTKYYTKVAYALDDAKNGGWYDILTDDEFFDSFDTTAEFGFVREGNFLVSEGDDRYSTSEASFVMDLENYEYDQIFTFAVNRTINPNSDSYYSYAQIQIYEGTDNTGTYLTGYSFNVGEYSNSIKLEKGKKYFIEIRHKNQGESYPEDSKLYITDMHLKDYIEEIPSPYEDMETTTVSKNYGFDYDATTGVFKSNNQYTSETTAFSYYEIDLTGETSNKELIINASLSAFGSDIGSIYVKTNNDSESSSNYNQSLLTLYGYGSNKPTITGPMTATATLQAGQKYYVQFYYFKQYSTKQKSEYDNAGVTDQFIINSMDIVDAGWTTELPFATMLQTPGDRGFAVNSSTYASTSGITHSYVPITIPADGQDLYAELDFSSYYDFRVFVTDSPELPSDLEAFEYKNPTTTGSTFYGPIALNLHKGTNYIHFYMPASSNGYAYLKTLKLKPGRAISITNDVKKSVGASRGFQEYRTSYPIAVYSEQSGIADSYVEIDLRDSETDVVLSVDQVLPSDGTAYMYLTDGKNAIDYNSIAQSNSPTSLELQLKYNYSNNGYYYGTFASSIYSNTNTYNIVVSKGKKYYLHFGICKSYYYYNYYVNKIVTRPVSDYYLKTGKQRYIPQSGSGSELPSDMVIDENNYNNLRYIGSSANNYVSFNGEIWRIIGVFNTEDENGVVKPRIKLVRNESLGQLSWDAFDTGMNSTGLDGYNEWSQAKLMKLMNPGYDSEDTNNSLYWNRASGNCLYYDSSTYSKSNSCDFSSNGLTTTSQSMLDKVVWYTSPIDSSEYGNMSPYQIYEAERNGTTLGYNLTTEYPSWTGYVGLVNMSDYIMATDGFSSYTRNQCMSTAGTMYTTCVANNSWMKGNGSPYATINPQKTGDTYSSGPLFYQAMATGPSTSPTYQSYQVMPSVYLSTKIQITGGEGTARKPYTLSLGDSDNEKMNDYYGLIPEPEDTGEVIDYETDDYEDIKGGPVYGFEYDEESGYYISTNAYAGASTAAAYIVIDRTAELNDATLNFIYDKSSYNYSNGVIIIVPDQYDPNIDVGSYDTYKMYRNYSVYDDETQQLVDLPAGHKYYIVFGFKKNYSDQPSGQYRENMRVKIEGLEYTPSTTTVTKYNGIEMRYNEEVDTIQILKNINMPEGLVNEETKDVILDLNGYSLTTYSNDPVITNNGKFTIIDTRENGKVVTSQTDAIKNNATGKLIIESGSVEVDNRSAGVYNLGEVSVKEDGVVKVVSSGGVGIKNVSNGNILNGQGTFSGGTGIELFISSSDTEFGGYNFDNSTISIETSNPITINNITGTAGISLERASGYVSSDERNVVINDSEFNSFNTSVYSSGTVVINNSDFNQLNVTDSFSITNITVDNSNIDNVINKGQNTVINNSTVGTIQNGFYDNSTGAGTLVLDGTIVDSITNDYRVTLKGQTEVTGGIINNKQLTVGVNDETIDSVYPKVTGLVNAVDNTNFYYNGPTFNYYDGSLTGNEGKVITNYVNNTPEDATIISTVEDGRETWSLDKQYVCAIGNDKYYSIQDAVDSITTDAETEIDILVDLIDATKTTIPTGKNVKLDYNGHKVSVYSNSWITNNGTLTIFSSSDADDSIVYSKKWVVNNGTFTNENINVVIDNRKISDSFIDNSGSFIMNDGSILILYDGTDNNKGHVIFNNTGTVTINDGILQSFRIVDNAENATFNINGGNIYSYYFNKQSSYASVEYYYVPIRNNGTVNVSGGNFGTVNAAEAGNDYSYLFTNTSTGSLNVTGGSFDKEAYFVYNDAGTAMFDGVTDLGFLKINNKANSTLTFDNCEFVEGSSNLSIDNQSTVSINNSTKANNSKVLTVSSGAITITNSTLNNIDLSGSNGLVINNCTINKAKITAGSTSSIIDSTIIDNTPKSTTSPNSLVSFSGTLSIKNSTLKTTRNRCINNNGTLTLGEKDGNVSDTMPSIEGAEVGVYNNTGKTFNFYDGVITGLKNQSIYGSISDIETGFDVISFDIDDGKESSILSTNIIIQNIDTEAFYSSIQTAIDEANSGETLQLLRNYNYISGTASITIPATKNIILDMNGHNIDNRTSTQFTISNSGTLSIVDTTTVTNNYIFNSNDTISVFENSGNLSVSSIIIHGSLINNQNAVLNTTGLDADKIENYGQAQISPLFGPSTGVTSTIQEINNYSTGDMTTNGQVLLKDVDNYGHMDINRTSISALHNLENGILDIQYILGPTGLSETYSFGDNSVATIQDGNIGIVVNVSDNAKLVVKSGSFDGFHASGNAELIIEGGSVSSSRNIPLTSSSSVPVTLGVKDGTVNDYPRISKQYQYGSSLTAISVNKLNFYDGKAYGQYNDDAPIVGEIVDIEDNHNVVIDSHYEYLSPDSIVKNVNTNTEYTDFERAMNEASSGDELKVLQSFVNNKNITVASGDDLSFDLNGKFIVGNPTYTVTNEGTLSIRNGELKSSTITNSGTLNINASGKVGDITNTGTVNVNSGRTGYINNSDTINMSGGYISRITNNGTTTISNNGSVDTITNNDTLTINLGTVSTINNNKDLVMSGGKVGTLNNNSDSNALLKDGDITITNIYNKEYLKIKDANITVKVTGKNFSDEVEYYGVIGNFKTIDVENVNITLSRTGHNFYDSPYIFLNGYLTYESSGKDSSAVLNMNGVDTDASLIGNNCGTINMDDVTATGYTKANWSYHVGDYDYSGTLNINNSSIAGLETSINTTINDSTVSGIGTSNLYVTSLDINRSTVGSIYYNYADTININDNSIVNGSITGYGGSTININNTATVNGYIDVYNDATLNVYEGATITSTEEYAIYNKGTTTIGLKDGNYNSSSPEITGTTCGIKTSGTLKFYDGVIKGVSAVNGLVDEVETGYVIDITEVDGLQNERLKIPGENERVIIFNNINYTTLQAAVNASLADVTNEMVLYTDYTLTADINIPENRTIKLYLNGHNLNYDSYNINVPTGSSFTTESGAPTGWTGSLSGIGSSNTSKDIIIYQMADGNELSVEETYKLYKLMDGSYKIVAVSENSIGDYSISGTIEKMKTIKGRLYLNGLEQGSYKLVSNKGREIDFEIGEDGISNNIRLNNSIFNGKIESSSVAIVILTFATGMLRTPWIILLLLVFILVILGVIAIKKKEKIKEVE